MMRVRYVLVLLILTASISSCSVSPAERTEPTPTTALTSAGKPVAIVQLCAPAQSDGAKRDMASFVANSIQRSPLGSTVTAVSVHIRTPEGSTASLTCGDFQSHDFTLPPSHLRKAWTQ